MARPGLSTGAPCPLWTPRRRSFHPAVSLHTIKPWTRHSRGAKIWHVPHNDLPWRSKPGHTMEIQAASHNGDPKTVNIMEIQAGSHNGDPSRFTQWRSKPIHTVEIQAGSHNGGSSRFTQWRSKPWRSKAGSHNGGSRRSTQWRSKAGSHNGGSRRSTQWRSKAGSHNGDPNQFTQWRSKLVHTMDIQPLAGRVKEKRGGRQTANTTATIGPQRNRTVGRGHLGLEVIKGAHVYLYSQPPNDHPNPSQRQLKRFGKKNKFAKIFRCH